MNQALDFSAISTYILMPVFALVLVVFYLTRKLKKKNEVIERERAETSRRLYELSILKELGERAGYSLDVEEILSIITGSLKQFIDYSTVGYIVINPNQLKLNMHLEEPVSRKFLSEMKSKMIGSISALTDKTYDLALVDEVVSGAIPSDDAGHSIGSFFNIPLVIDNVVEGVLTIANVKKGMYMEKDMNVLYKMTNQASRAVSRLREVVEIEKRKLSSMVESMGDGVLMVDSKFQVLVANPAIKKIVKFDSERQINIFDFVDALGGKFDIRGRLEEAVAKNKPYISEKVNIDSSFFEIGVYPVTHTLVKGGLQVLGAVVVFHDITRDIELEKVREEFTSMVVHELRSPLDGIKKIVEFILSESIDSKSEQFLEYMNMVHQSSASMLELVNDILDLSKLQAGKFTIEKENSSIKDVIENRIAFYKVSASTRKLVIDMNLNSDLPENSSFDPKAIKQILNNLLSNALKFTSQGGIITVSAFVFGPGSNLPIPDKSKVPVFPEPKDIKAKEKSLCVVVSDTGIGIPVGAMDDLFKNYQQAKLSPVVKDVKGTGLGLAIAKGVAEAHGGTVGAVSKEGVGSSFFFTIPL